MRLAVLGPEGSFSHAVAKRYFPHGDLTITSSIDEAFDLFEEGEVGALIIPLHYPHLGFVEETVDQLIDFSGAIMGEVLIPLSYNLVGHVKLEESQSLLLDPFAYKCCKQTITKLCPHCQIVLTETDAEASALLTPQSVAITSASEADLNQIPLIVKGVEDHPDQQGRFLILGEQGCSLGNKSSLILLSLHSSIEAKEVPLLFQKSAADLLTFSLCNDSMYWIDCLELTPSLLCELEELADFKLLGSYPHDPSIHSPL